MESRRLPSRRNKRADSPTLKDDSSPILSRRGGSSNRTSSPGRNEKISSNLIDNKKRGRPKAAPVKIEEKDPKELFKKNVAINVPSVDEFKNVKESSTSMHSVKTTSSVRTINLSGGGGDADAEIARLTSMGQTLLNRRSTSKAPTTPLHHLTPTPTTEHSRQSRSVSRSVYDDDDYSRTEYSDNEEIDYGYKNVRNQQSSAGGLNEYSGGQRSIYTNTDLSSHQKPLPREFGGIIGIILLLFMVPIISFYLQWCCTKSSQCELKMINLTGWNFEFFERVFDFYAVVAYLGFQFMIFILSSFPLGRTVSICKDRTTLRYYFNSLTVTILTIIAYLVGEFYMKLPITDFMIRNYLRFFVFSISNALIISFWCFIMSRFHKVNESPEIKNPYGKTGNILIDYSVGREINPKWCGLVDIKLSHYRISLITMICMIMVLILKNLQLPIIQSTTTITNEQELQSKMDILKYFLNQTSFIDTSALFCTILFMSYVLDIIIFEHHLASSFDLQQEGVGAFLLLRYAVTPYFLASVPKYALEHKSLNLPTWAMCLTGLIFIIALLVKRSANGIKYKFRMNPNTAQFMHLDTIPTFQGRRILADHLWGHVRQPNYAGDILQLISFMIPMIWKFAWPPVICIVFIIISLIHRAIRVNARNFERYISAWTRYTTKVRHILLPKVF